jgi:hypothetical protein
MRVAVLLSGRVKSYESFLRVLENACKKHEIDVFISVNDTYSEFYETLKQRFGSFLKGLECTPYKLPEDWHYTHAGAKTLPYINAMSCFYNDENVFRMACEYADKNKILYDVYLRTRSDIDVATNDFPEFDSRVSEGLLFCVRPLWDPKLWFQDTDPTSATGCYGKTIHSEKLATADVGYGNRDAMSIYCGTYRNILKRVKEENGNYIVWFEPCLTIHLEESGYPWEFFTYTYEYSSNRRG